ncbi:hypothetical protein MMPV_007598 [Pyropia vietnamensis]
MRAARARAPADRKSPVTAGWAGTLPGRLGARYGCHCGSGSGGSGYDSGDSGSGGSDYDSGGSDSGGSDSGGSDSGGSDSGRMAPPPSAVEAMGGDRVGAGRRVAAGDKLIDLILRRVGAPPPPAPYTPSAASVAALTSVAATCRTLATIAAPLTAAAVACGGCGWRLGHPRAAVAPPPGAVPPAGEPAFVRLADSSGSSGSGSRSDSRNSGSGGGAPPMVGTVLRGVGVPTWEVWRELFVWSLLPPAMATTGRARAAMALLWCGGCGGWVGFESPGERRDRFLAKVHVALVDGRGRRLPRSPPPPVVAASLPVSPAASPLAPSSPASRLPVPLLLPLAPPPGRGGEGVLPPSPPTTAAKVRAAGGGGSGDGGGGGASLLSPAGEGIPSPPPESPPPPDAPSLPPTPPPITGTQSCLPLSPPPVPVCCATCGAPVTTTAELLPWQHVLGGTSLDDMDPYTDWSPGYTPAGTAPATDAATNTAVATAAATPPVVVPIAVGGDTAGDVAQAISPALSPALAPPPVSAVDANGGVIRAPLPARTGAAAAVVYARRLTGIDSPAPPPPLPPPSPLPPCVSTLSPSASSVSPSGSSPPPAPPLRSNSLARGTSQSPPPLRAGRLRVADVGCGGCGTPLGWRFGEWGGYGGGYDVARRWALLRQRLTPDPRAP